MRKRKFRNLIDWDLGQLSWAILEMVKTRQSSEEVEVEI
jgi:hypothetical protein